MSGQLIGGVIGAAIGFFAGGNVAAGWAIGSAIGGAVAPGSLPDKIGPRLTDLRPQSSEYGRPLPIVYGTVGIGGNVIWAAPLFELQQVTEQGGKGGGPTQNTVNFSYYSYFAVAICEGERTIGRIWAGPEKRLVYDGNGFVEGGDFGLGAVRCYTGSEDQLPDPLLEFYLGVGNVPAYRGTCYVVFQNFPVVNDGNRIPFLTVEVGTPGVPEPVSRDPVYLGLSAPVDPPSMQNLAALVASDGTLWSVCLELFGLSHIEMVVNSDVTQTRIADVVVSDPTRYVVMTGMVEIPISVSIGPTIVVYGTKFSNRDCFWMFDMTSRTFIEFIEGKSVGTASLQLMFYNPVQGITVAVRFNGVCDNNPFSSVSVPSLEWNIADGNSFGSYGTVSMEQVVLTPSHYAVLFSGSNDGVAVRSLADDTFVMDYTEDGFGGTMFYDGDRNRLVVAKLGPSGTFWVIDLDTFATTSHTFTPAVDADAGDSMGVVSAVYYGGYYLFGAEPGSGGDHSTLHLIDPVTLTAVHSYAYETTAGTGTTYLMKSPLLAPAEAGLGYVYSYDQASVKRLYFAPAPVALGGQLLSEVVIDLSERAGLLSSQVDAEQLTDIVDGYAIAKRTSVRSAIDPLRQVYYFDAVESGGVAKFVKRGGAVAREIDDADLAAHEGGGESPDPLATVRQMEDEMPQRVSANYLLAASKYGPATKEAVRKVGYSEGTTTIELPLVLSDTKAQEVADVNLHVAWAQRLSYTLDLPRKHSDLEVTDVISAKGHTMRITKIVDTPAGVRHVSAVRDASHFYLPHVIVTETPPPTEEVATIDETLLELM
ncbi:phage tail protein [Variovorax paradoxus]|nr:phage tail protein [Variovorax paradoxus]